MSDTPNTPPEEGARQIFDLIGEIGEATAAGDLDRLGEIIDRMEGVVADTGVEIPGIGDRIAAMKSQTVKAKWHIENTDAALWVGDLKRAEALTMAGPALDMGALHGEAYDVDESEDEAPDFEITFEVDGDEGDEEFDLSDFAASLGLDPEAAFHATEPEEDAYADIAEGATGAIEALIDSGVDLNEPSGPSRHTPLLAALDAPGRSAAGIGKLIAAGADPRVVHEQGDNAISWAMGYHHLDTVTPAGEAALIELLVSHGADVNHWIGGMMNALQRAILQGGAPQVAALLAMGADASIDMAEDFVPEKLASATLVMVAAAKPDVLQVLLDHGADARRADALGRTPLDFVAAEAAAARARVDADDGWTIDHAEALEISLGLLERHLAH